MPTLWMRESVMHDSHVRCSTRRKRAGAHQIINTNPIWLPKINKIMYHFTWLHITLFECLQSGWGVCNAWFPCEMFHQKGNEYFRKSRQIQIPWWPPRINKIMYHFTWLHVRLFECLYSGFEVCNAWLLWMWGVPPVRYIVRCSTSTLHYQNKSKMAVKNQ